MDTKDISLFLAIARIGSISKTADSLYMSQSTVTTHLQRLEHALGYALFLRVQSGVRLTAEGERFLPLAERMLELEELMTKHEHSVVPVLRVMSGRAFVSTDVPSCLVRMLKRHNIRPEVRMGMYDEMTDALVASQVDFCFLGEPIYHPRVHQLELPADAIDLIVPAAHLFASHFPGIHALSEVPFIAFGRDKVTPFRARVMRLLAEEGVFPSVRMELDSIDGIKAMVSHGLGVSCLPRRTLSDAKVKGYAVIPLQKPAWTRPTLLAYPETAPNPLLRDRFIEVVREYYAELAP